MSKTTPTERRTWRAYITALNADRLNADAPVDSDTCRAMARAHAAYLAAMVAATATRLRQHARRERRRLAVEPDYAAEPYRDPWRGLMTASQCAQMDAWELTHDERDNERARLPYEPLPRY